MKSYAYYEVINTVRTMEKSELEKLVNQKISKVMQRESNANFYLGGENYEQSGNLL
ncbi:MAG: hypothetical protein FWE47_00015 [Oscillospiraceae bacterium]|nr:hypothetical protein [Oscillospiraceae bacterium]